MAEKLKKFKRVKTPTVIQMEAVECGAASLSIILGYFKRFVPLEELRIKTGVSRDGVKASNMVKAARTYGLVPKAARKSPDALRSMKCPMIIHWNFNHFLVLEGFKGNKVYLNDPGCGPRMVTKEEFDKAFTGVAIQFETGPDFKPGGQKKSMLPALIRRIKGSGDAMTYIFLVGLALVIPGIVIPAFSRIFIDNILLMGMTGWVRPLLIGMFITTCLRGGLMILQQYYLLKLETKLSLTSSAGFIWHIFRLPVVFFSQRNSGDISSRITANDGVANLIAEKLTSSAVDLLMIVFYAVLMFQYDVWLTLAGIVIALINLGMLALMSRKQTDANGVLLQDRGKYFATSMSGLQLIETLKAGGTESDFFTKWGGYQAKLMNAEQKLGKTTQVLGQVPMLLSALNTAIILTLGGFRVIEGHLTLGMLVAFQSLMGSFMGPVNNMVTLGSSLQLMQGDMNRLDDVLQYGKDEVYDREEDEFSGDITNIQNDVNDAVNEMVQPKLSGFVELKDVSFGYNILEPPLIEKLNISLQPGTRVALVGGSGSGKSTVAKLIAGLYKPWSGEILLDGKSRDELPRELICNSLAVIDQDICMFKGSIRENLSLWDNSITEKAMVRAAEDASIHNEIAMKPGGYGHELHEGGTNFSGGQRQRLEIARALVGNPSILILDEATSALDPLTEKDVDTQLRRRGCTCIIVAHRLSTIRDCDEIIVLDRGKVAQRGRHEELVKQGGHYAELIKAT